MKSDIDEVALQGIEFWSNVCDEEMDLAIEASEVCGRHTLYSWFVKPRPLLKVSCSLPVCGPMAGLGAGTPAGAHQ